MDKYKFSKYNITLNTDEQYTLIYNCYSGGIIKLENDVYWKIIKDNFLLKDIKYGQELLANGFIVNSHVDEFNRVKMQLESVLNEKWQETVSYVIAPTLNCNLNCVYCFQKDFRTYGTSNIITDDMLNKIKTFIVNSNSHNKLLKKIKITWFGGEPLLCYEQIVSFCKSIIEELTKYDISFECSIISNGILLNESRLKELTTECNLKRIQITLDGEENTYCSKKQTTKESYIKVIENICISTKYAKTVVRVNADKKNYDELLRLSQSLYEMDVNKENLIVHFAQLRDYQNKCTHSPFFTDFEFWQYKNEFYDSLSTGKNSDEDNKNRLNGFSCAPFCGLARKNNFVIDYAGNLYKCEHYIGEKDKIVGTVEDGIFYNDIYLKSLTVQADDRCKECNIFPYCNYSRCTAMYEFAGNSSKCLCYNEQLNVIQDKMKKYI